MHRAILRLSLFVLVVLALLVSGCTDSGDVAGPQTPLTTLPTAESTDQATTLQTPVTTATVPYSPEYQAADLVSSPGGAEDWLITAVDTTNGTYRIRTVVGDGDAAYVLYDNRSADTPADAREFDESGVTQQRIVMQIPIKDGSGNLQGGFVYDTPETMRFVAPSPELLAGEVDYVLTIRYNGTVWIFSELDGTSPSEWTDTIDEKKEFPLGTGRGAYVTVKKAAPVSGVLSAALSADGVVVAESENDSPVALLSLSFSTA
ncbi:hypothetical protein ABH15_10105 [Methanoculleus taiwanensis]|uniref:Uncharacterized protein n=1 Tax=Methanoculleus taiwanensis TaxID=1550565 RepID=A0A498H2F6_9EURY|nr:hypothetical protein [Methanoculleus taiwanensis]RXE56425.1 hypothetical protein ABH15_10105 [Methanoculleus taiwanensis]